ncbi:MAG TPA: hypothetical protein VM573_08210, partial [Actinomycetota bacterium]|nr:hypothetical protein [Actinomycetota bacterium]
MTILDRLADRAARGERLSDEEIRSLASLSVQDPAPLLAAAAARRDASCGPRVTYSRKVFIPLTKLCR